MIYLTCKDMSNKSLARFFNSINFVLNRFNRSTGPKMFQPIQERLCVGINANIIILHSTMNLCSKLPCLFVSCLRSFEAVATKQMAALCLNMTRTVVSQRMETRAK